jgi:hypothetical protein
MGRNRKSLPLTQQKFLSKSDQRKFLDKYEYIYRVFHFQVSISAPRVDLGSKYQQILTFARASSIWGSHPLDAKARSMPVDFSEARAIKPVR